MKFKALSVHQPYARLIATGQKTAELRSRKTTYRGDILICSTKKKFGDPAKYPLGMAICLAELYDVEKADESAREQVFPHHDPGTKITGYLWKLRNIRVVDPFPVKGQQGFYYIEHSLADMNPEPIVPDELHPSIVSTVTSILVTTVAILIVILVLAQLWMRIF